MDLAREWTAFSGALFSLMGVSLAAAARRSAEDALSWQRQWRDAVGAPHPAREEEEPKRRRLTLAYRCGGLFFAAAGLGLLVAAPSSRAAFGVHGGPRETLIGGVFFTVCGLVLVYGAWRRAGRGRAPRFLDGELLADGVRPLGERIAEACSRGMVALFLVFGARLLWRALR